MEAARPTAHRTASGQWDSIATTNPSLCPLPDGSFLLAYKSRKENLGQLQVGVALAPHITGPWKRQPTPWRFRGQPAHVEDSFLWYEDGRVQALMKDMTLASQAIALANIVLPVPGGPISRTPLGNLPHSWGGVPVP